jgi:hypothetical protein
MSKSNIQIAKEYAAKMYEMTSDDGVWLSTNLNTLPRGDRRAILKVYESVFPFVTYDSETGACYCRKKQPVEA